MKNYFPRQRRKIIFQFLFSFSEEENNFYFPASYVASIMVSKTTHKLSFLASLKEIILKLINGIAYVMDFNQPSQSHPYEPLGESLV